MSSQDDPGPRLDNTRAELAFVSNLGIPPDCCLCWKLENAEFDDWVSVHVQIGVEYHGLDEEGECKTSS